MFSDIIKFALCVIIIQNKDPLAYSRVFPVVTKLFTKAIYEMKFVFIHETLTQELVS